jgi:hypothetical protein
VGTHWAYLYFIEHLFAQSVPPLALPGAAADQYGDRSKLPILHAVGDSHVLSLAWQVVLHRGEAHLVKPHVVTGLKVKVDIGTRKLTA